MSKHLKFAPNIAELEVVNNMIRSYFQIGMYLFVLLLIILNNYNNYVVHSSSFNDSFNSDKLFTLHLVVIRSENK